MHKPQGFKWPRRDADTNEHVHEAHIKKLNPERDRKIMIAGSVVAAMLVGGTVGWIGATMIKPSQEPQSPKTERMGMPQETRHGEDVPHDESIQAPIFTEETLRSHKTISNPDETARLYEEPLPVEIEVSNHGAQVAALPPADQADVTQDASKAPWLKNAIAFTPQPNLPMIAIVIDDVGIDRRRSSKIMAMHGPFTLSFLSYAQDLRQQTTKAHKAGHELFLHMPMEPFGDGYDPGPDVLLTSMTPMEIQSRLSQSLGSFNGYVGINNHMGSKFTADAKGMSVVMAELKKRGLLFLDSLTSGKSVAAKVATSAGVPNLTRHVFLDNSPKPADIDEQIRRLEKLAKKHGSAIAIGHPRETTIQALQTWLPTLENKGIQLVPLSTLAKIKYGIL